MIRWVAVLPLLWLWMWNVHRSHCAAMAFWIIGSNRQCCARISLVNLVERWAKSPCKVNSNTFEENKKKKMFSLQNILIARDVREFFGTCVVRCAVWCACAVVVAYRHHIFSAGNEFALTSEVIPSDMESIRLTTRRFNSCIVCSKTLTTKSTIYREDMKTDSRA